MLGFCLVTRCCICTSCGSATSSNNRPRAAPAVTGPNHQALGRNDAHLCRHEQLYPVATEPNWRHWLWRRQSPGTCRKLGCDRAGRVRVLGCATLNEHQRLEESPVRRHVRHGNAEVGCSKSRQERARNMRVACAVQYPQAPDHLATSPHVSSAPRAQAASAHTICMSQPASNRHRRAPKPCLRYRDPGGPSALLNETECPKTRPHIAAASSRPGALNVSASCSTALIHAPYASSGASTDTAVGNEGSSEGGAVAQTANAQ